jgi:hypothetical protein
MRERDRELKRRRHRRQKRLKKQPAEDIHRPERPSGTKRAVKKVPPTPAETAGNTSGNHAAAVAPPPAEAPPKKKPAAKKAPAKKAPAKPAAAEAPAPPAPAAADEPEEPQGA